MPSSRKTPRRTPRKSLPKSLPTALSKTFGPLTNLFPPFEPFSADYVASLHQAALTLLQDQGIKVLYQEARKILAQAGARVSGEDVFLGAEIIEAAIATAPATFTLRGATPARDLPVGPGSLIFQPGGGTPNASDRVRGRRPGSLQDFRELIHLIEAFDVLHLASPVVEPQDVPPALRHLETLSLTLEHSSKVPAIYARGREQVEDGFALIQMARGLDSEAFQADPHAYTVINTNSPRQIDVPMAQGLIDFARAGQASVITPFTLMGAMAPITVAGALVLSHAEALAALTLAQLARPGAPVFYGTFTSNVHMKSGSPAFGTPEHFQASAGAGQLARHIGLPWRSATGTAANLADAQGAHETQLGIWGCLMGGANTVFHAAGWLEGGLCLGYEKLISDVELLTMLAELCQGVEQTPDALAADALAQVEPGGHFFATDHTLARYRTAFYDPLVHQTTPFEAWEEAGQKDTSARATEIWQNILANPPKVEAPGLADGLEQVKSYKAKRIAEGGAAPL